MKYLLSAVLIWGVSTSCKLFAESYGQAKSVVKPANTVKAKNGSVPTEINYQGWLGDTTDTMGVTDILGMIFRLYTSSTGGSPIWNESHIAIPVDKGIFNVYLGETNPLPTNIFTGDPLWLEIQVMTDTLSPRKKLVSVGYAIRSENANNAVYADTTNYIAGANVDGEVAQANHADTADYVAGGVSGGMKLNIQSDATEYTTSNLDWTEVKTFNFTPPTDSTVITKLTILCDMKRSGDGITGGSLGMIVNAPNMGDYVFWQTYCRWEQDSIPRYMYGTHFTTYVSPRLPCPCCFTAESSYSIKLYLKAQDDGMGGTGIPHIRNTTLVIEYLER